MATRSTLNPTTAAAPRWPLVPALALLLAGAVRADVSAPGAEVPWITVEAEAMHTNGTVLGPSYAPYLVETESSGQRCVRLDAAGQFVEFVAPAEANAIVVRYSLPDSARGGGVTSSLRLMVNGRPVRTLALTSRYTHLYGAYPFSNDPRQGKARNFYDELRVKGLAIARGDVVRLEHASGDAVPCWLDLVDLEEVPPPLAAPANAVSVRDCGARGDGVADDTAAVRAGLAAAQKQGRTLWVEPGDYKVTGDLEVPSGVTIQGAGMWHTTFVGDEAVYGDAARRVRLRLVGRGMRLADFAIVGRLNYRNDSEPNDGVVGAGCADASMARIWIEHTKVGAWIYNGTHLRIEACRFRDLLADGVNLCVGSSGCVIENCSARGTGDDCFAIWPVPSDQGFLQGEHPGHNVIRHCTGQLPFLANGGSLYGGAGNRIEDCLFTDITAGCGILVSTTFPTSDEARGIDNNFSETTEVRRCTLLRCGGYDHDWAWRGAFQICLDRRSISGLAISDLVIRDSFSDGLMVVAPGSARGQGTLSHCRLENIAIGQVGLEGPGHHELFVRADARGGLTLAGPPVADVRNDSAEFRIGGGDVK